MIDTEPVATAREAEILEQILPLYLEQARQLAKLLAAKADEQLLGKTEFQLRDQLHQLGAATLQHALQGRKKGATNTPL